MLATALANSSAESNPLAELHTLTTSELRNKIGEILAALDQGGGSMLLVTHDKPRAVLISCEDYVAMKGGAKNRALDLLSNTYDQLVATMEAPAARSAVKEAFDADPAVFRSLRIEQ